MDDNGRTTGIVQWFSRVKGFGFVRPDEQEEDVFVHYSSIRGDGYRNLDEGQRVEFTMEDTPKGPQAVDVVGLDFAPSAVESDVVPSAVEFDVAPSAIEFDVAPSAVEFDVAPSAVEFETQEADVAEAVL